MRIVGWVLVAASVAVGCGITVEATDTEQAAAGSGGTSSVAARPSSGGRATGSSGGKSNTGAGGFGFAGEPQFPSGGAAGEPAVGVGGAAVDAAGGAGACGFEYLGDWLRCEGDDNWPWLRRVDNHSLDDCKQACLADAACVAVVDWYYFAPELGCVLDVSVCEHPATNAWAEEDGGKEYRKVCGEP